MSSTMDEVKALATAISNMLGGIDVILANPAYALPKVEPPVAAIAFSSADRKDGRVGRGPRLSITVSLFVSMGNEPDLMGVIDTLRDRPGIVYSVDGEPRQAHVQFIRRHQFIDSDRLPHVIEAAIEI